MIQRNGFLAGGSVVLVLAATLAAPSADAGFAAADLFIPGVGRLAGYNSSQWYSTLWVTNLSSVVSVDLDAYFLEADSTNPSPSHFHDTLLAGETKRYANCVETLFGKTGVSGTLHLVASGDIAAVSRTFDQPTGTSLRESKGYFYNGIPASFAVGAGESTFLLGLAPAETSSFRFNYSLVETTGGGGVEPTTVTVSLKDGSGAILGTKEHSLGPWQATRQYRIDSVFPGVTATDARLEATVTGGEGEVLLSGALVATASNDAAGIEMIYRPSLLSSYSADAVAGIASNAVETALAVADRVYAVAAQALAFGSYDENTGWWDLKLTLETGQAAVVKVQFQNSEGQAQKLYNPLTVTTILVTGEASGTQGTVTFDLNLAGTNQGASALAVDGDGEATYEGVSGSFVVEDLTIPKAIGEYPSDGTITVTSGAATATVTFDGTQLAHGMYVLGPLIRTFTIDLETGEITWS